MSFLLKNKEAITFLLLMLASSSIMYAPMLMQHSIYAGGGTAWLMWCPGFAALVTALIYRHNLKGFGWLPGNIKWLALGYFIPIAYSLVAYTVIWATGIGGIPNADYLKDVSHRFPEQTVALTIARHMLDLMVVAFVPGLLKPLGEEIGWRGFLVPELAKKMSFAKTSLIVGIIWAVWHYPAILCTDYNIGTPGWCAIPCFTVLVIEVSFVSAWLRLRSKSLWPSVLLHGSHNAIIQEFFTPITIDKGYTKYFIDEFGLGLVLTAGIVAWLCWTHKDDLKKLKSV